MLLLLYHRHNHGKSAIVIITEKMTALIKSAHINMAVTLSLKLRCYAEWCFFVVVVFLESNIVTLKYIFDYHILCVLFEVNIE